MPQDMGLASGFGTGAFTDAFVQMLAQQEQQRIQKQQLNLQQQKALEEAAQTRAAEARQTQDLQFRQTQEQRQIAALAAKDSQATRDDQGVMDEIGKLPDGPQKQMVSLAWKAAKTGHPLAAAELMGPKPAPAGSDFNQFLQRKAVAAGKSVDQLTPEEELAARKEFQGATNAPAGSDYAHFLERRAKTLNKPIGEMTDAEELQARKDFGQADDAAHRPPVPLIIQGPNGWEIVDRGQGVAKPVTEGSTGAPLALPPTAEQRNRAGGRASAGPVLSAIRELSEKINTGQGVMAKITGTAERLAAKANLDDDISEYEAVISGFIPLLARAVGHVGVLTQQDVDSVKAMLPKPSDSKSLRDRKVARIDTIMAGMAAVSPAGGQPAAPGARPGAEAGLPPAPPPVSQRIVGKTEAIINGVPMVWQGRGWQPKPPQQ